MQDTTGEAGTSSSVMYSYWPTHMAEQKQDDQLEHTYSSYVRIRDVALKTCQRWWTIGKSGERGSGISVLAARHDDDDIYYQSKVFGPPQKILFLMLKVLFLIKQVKYCDGFLILNTSLLEPHCKLKQKNKTKQKKSRKILLKLLIHQNAPLWLLSLLHWFWVLFPLMTGGTLKIVLPSFPESC